MLAAPELAQRLRDLRRAADLTQTELASRAGISRAYLAALERGFSSATKAPPNPSRELLASLAHALGVTVADLRGIQPTLPLPLQLPSPASGPDLLGAAPGPRSGGQGDWRLPESDGVVAVQAGVDEGLGLVPGDHVLVRRLGPDERAEGLCLLESGKTWTWGRLAWIASQPYVSAPDGSFRPLSKETRAIARAIALVRSLEV